MSYYLFPSDGKPASIAPSLQRKKRGIGTNGETNGTTNGTTSATNARDSLHPYGTLPEPNNPTVVPKALLADFHFTFLIRDPHSSIPSYYRCTIPPLDKITGFYDYIPSEAGYAEVRRMFEFLGGAGIVGPHHANGWNSNANNPRPGSPVNGTEICVVDADDLLDEPQGVIEAYCKSVGIPFTTKMLNWNNEDDQNYAKAAFEKWKGFHEDAINSTELKPRTHVSVPKSIFFWSSRLHSDYYDVDCY